MDTPFVYSKYVSGKHFVGRSVELQAFANLLTQGENLVLYEIPKSGITSLIQQGFFKLKSSGIDFIPVSISLLNKRSVAHIVLELASNMLRSIANTAEEYARLLPELLPDSCFVFDAREFAENGSVVSLGWEISNDDIVKVLTLPYRIAARQNCRMFVLVEEFQNLFLAEGGESCCKLWERVLKERSEDDKLRASYIFCGSSYNAMDEIFAVKKFFYRRVERIELGEIEIKLIVDYIIKGLLASGKVVDRDLLHGVCSLFRSNMWYINHFTSICDSLTRGYIMEPTLNAALNILLSIHEPRFKAMMNDLTNFQVNMLRAVLCGYSKFSATEVIERFNLSSPANVKRLKDALSKKEIVNFNGDTPKVLDPLFEYWAKKVYYNI